MSGAKASTGSPVHSAVDLEAIIADQLDQLEIDIAEHKTFRMQGEALKQETNDSSDSGKPLLG